jgi:HAE1 family hydrophobic/amphiphilic exporter-1
MVVDAAIVVQENIQKWRERGLGLLESCLGATKEVYLAILASSLTTVAVFLPVVFVEDEAGQLFRDIALAIVVSILLSLVVSTTVIPPFYRWLFSRAGANGSEELRVSALVLLLKARIGPSVDALMAWLRWVLNRVWAKLALVVLTTVVSLFLSYWLAPKQEYLPNGNRNLVLSFLFPPPGYSPEETEKVGEFLIDDLRPLLSSEKNPDGLINRLFFIGFGTTLIFAGVAEEPERVQEMIAPINATLAKVPGMRFFTTQASLFSSALGAGRSIDVEVYGEDVNQMAGIVAGMFMKTRQIMPEAQIRPIPSFEIGTPEIRILPFPDRAARAGLTAADLGLIVDIYTDGRKIGEFPMPNGDTLDLVLKADGTALKRVDDFFSQALLAPNNHYVHLGAVADIRETVGPNQINHIGEGRAFTLRIMPPDSIPLQTALETIQTQLVDPALSEYAHIPGFKITLSGQADAFTKTRQSLQTGFILALAITFLLLVILFEDVLAPLVVMGSIPIAAAGGMALLWLVNQYIAVTPLDVLTMLGFVMLVGIVVNNPILIVDRALVLIRNENWPVDEAVLNGASARIRPIFMTTLTSVFGLLPLVLFPGAGSELYRGLGSAVLGGLLLSTFVSMVFVPTLFSLLQDVQRLFRGRAAEEEEDLLPKLARGIPGAAHRESHPAPET